MVLADKREQHFLVAQWRPENGTIANGGKQFKVAQLTPVETSQKSGTVCSGITGTVSPVKVAQWPPDYPPVLLSDYHTEIEVANNIVKL